jgi:hypothetical protein
VFGNVFLPRQPEQGTFRVALVIPQCLGGETNRHLMESKEISADRAVARRDQLQRFIEGLRDLAKRCRPVPPGLLGKLRGHGDDGDRVGERGFDQDRGHWDRYHYARNGWGLMQVYPMSFWEYVNVL